MSEEEIARIRETLSKFCSDELVEYTIEGIQLQELKVKVAEAWSKELEKKIDNMVNNIE